MGYKSNDTVMKVCYTIKERKKFLYLNPTTLKSVGLLNCFEHLGKQSPLWYLLPSLSSSVNAPVDLCRTVESHLEIFVKKY